METMPSLTAEPPPDGWLPVWAQDVTALSRESTDSLSDLLRSLAFGLLPNGVAVLASGADDGHVKVWNAATGNLVHDITQDGGSVQSLSFTNLPDGTSLLASGSDDGHVRLWNATTGNMYQDITVEIREWVPWEFSKLPDGTVEFGPGRDELGLRLGRRAERQPLAARPATFPGLLWSVSFTSLRDGTVVLASGDCRGQAKLRNLATGHRHIAITAHGGFVWSLASGTLPDGTAILASGGADGHVRLWDPATGDLLRDIAAHGTSVWSLAFGTLSDGIAILASGGADGHVRLWDPATGELVHDILAHNMECHPKVAIDLRPRQMLDHPRQSWKGYAVTKSEERFALTTLSSYFEDVRPLTADLLGGDWVRSVAFTNQPDGRPLLASGGGDGFVRLWDPVTGDLRQEITAVDGPVRAVAFTKLPDGRVILAVGGNHRVALLSAPAMDKQ